MINVLQMQTYRVTGQRQYLGRAALNTREYLRIIQQPNGLFWHGPNARFF
jgi:unsaturated rhamnogalacturonyl hydrolase